MRKLKRKAMQLLTIVLTLGALVGFNTASAKASEEFSPLPPKDSLPESIPEEGAEIELEATSNMRVMGILPYDDPDPWDLSRVQSEIEAEQRSTYNVYVFVGDYDELPDDVRVKLFFPEIKGTELPIGCKVTSKSNPDQGFSGRVIFHSEHEFRIRPVDDSAYLYDPKTTTRHKLDWTKPESNSDPTPTTESSLVKSCQIGDMLDELNEDEASQQCVLRFEVETDFVYDFTWDAKVEAATDPGEAEITLTYENTDSVTHSQVSIDIYRSCNIVDIIELVPESVTLTDKEYADYRLSEATNDSGIYYYRGKLEQYQLPSSYAPGESFTIKYRIRLTDEARNEKEVYLWQSDRIENACIVGTSRKFATDIYLLDEEAAMKALSPTDTPKIPEEPGYDPEPDPLPEAPKCEKPEAPKCEKAADDTPTPPETPSYEKVANDDSAPPKLVDSVNVETSTENESNDVTATLVGWFLNVVLFVIAIGAIFIVIMLIYIGVKKTKKK